MLLTVTTDKNEPLSSGTRDRLKTKEHNTNSINGNDRHKLTVVVRNRRHVKD